MRTRSRPPRVAALLLATATVPQAFALSAHSPRDLEAHPAFAVVLNEQHILNETLPDLLAQPLETPPHSSPPARHLLRSPSGQAFLCAVPAVTDEAKKRADAAAEADALIQAEEKERGLQHGLALLEPMRQGCLYQKQGWFTYSFCYGNEIRQFHEVRVAGAVGPSEDPNADAYTLGLAPEPTAVPASLSPGSALSKHDAQIPSRLGGGDHGGWDEGGRYLTQTWGGGTVCDKTGMPRTVEVQYHCNTQHMDRIALIRETSICHYVLLIHTPRLCGEPLFLEGHLKHQEPAATIECQPVVRKVPQQLSDAADAGAGRPPAAPQAEQTAEKHLGREQAQEAGAPPPQPAEPPHAPHSDKDLLDGHPYDEHSDDEHFDDEHSDETATSDESSFIDTMVALVYDPETGEIHSAVTDQGEEVYLESELRRQVTGEGAAGQGLEEGQGDAQEQEEDGKATVESLEALVKMMRTTLADALRDLNDPAVARADPAAPAAPQAGAGLVGEGTSAIETLIRAINAAGAGGAAGAAGPGQVPGLQKYLEQFQKEKKTVQVPRKAVVGSDAHEKLRQGFARRYEEDAEGEGKKERPRDEL
ncbi:hypothetical protein JCM10207_007981 [Rhodosporidiobolus poonsookiae]